MFRVSQHPSSGVLKTVPAAPGTDHTTCTATPLQHGLVWTSCTSRVVGIDQFDTPDDGCCDTRNMQSSFAVNKYLHTVASVGFFIHTLSTLYYIPFVQLGIMTLPQHVQSAAPSGIGNHSHF